MSTLRGYEPEVGVRQTGIGQTVRHVYNILPNYWRGYSRSAYAAEQLCIGTTIIERSKTNNNLWSLLCRV